MGSRFMASSYSSMALPHFCARKASLPRSLACWASSGDTYLSRKQTSEQEPMNQRLVAGPPRACSHASVIQFLQLDVHLLLVQLRGADQALDGGVSELHLRLLVVPLRTKRTTRIKLIARIRISITNIRIIRRRLVVYLLDGLGQVLALHLRLAPAHEDLGHELEGRRRL